jgi:hypothetical protein
LRGRWGQSQRLFSPVNAQAFVERHDGTRPAHAPCSLTRFMEWELGSRRSDSPDIGASRCTAQEAAVWHSDPNRAVPARMTSDARGLRSTERGSSRHAPRGVGTGAKSSTGSERSLHNVPRHGASVARSAEAGACYSASPDSRSWSANSRDPYAATHRTTVLPHHVSRVTHGIDVA